MTTALRMLWWLAKWAARGVRWVGRGIAQLAGPASSDDFLGRHAAAQHWPAGLEAEVRRLEKVFRDSFCGDCAAGPDYPQGRCPKCLEKLGGLLGTARAA